MVHPMLFAAPYVKRRGKVPKWQTRRNWKNKCFEGFRPGLLPKISENREAVQKNIRLVIQISFEFQNFRQFGS
jgi:hypothetical protein